MGCFMKRTATLAALCLVLAGCSVTSNTDATSTPTALPSPPSQSEATSPSPEPTPDRAEVSWADYAPAVKSDIDAMTSAGDCIGLQTQFDTADANNQATMDRVGHNNAALMSYIDESMRMAGCY